MSIASLDSLDPQQQMAIVALMNETTVRKAAEVVGVHEKTLHRWLEDPAFEAVYRRVRRDAFKQAISQAQRYAPVALNVLVQIAADAKAPHSARVSAATGVLKFGRESLELDDLAARVEQLEQAAKAPPGAAA
jgi:predicted site-specific integrase-resolvase